MWLRGAVDARRPAPALRRFLDRVHRAVTRVAESRPLALERLCEKEGTVEAEVHEIILR